MQKDKVYTVGKVDYDNSGRNANLVTVEYSLNNGRFSMTATVWNAKKTDCLVGGQCLETVAELFPDDAKLQSMVKVWRRWHLNDMRAGTPKQEEFLRSVKHEHSGYYGDSWYDWATRHLNEAGLNPDDDYKYGSAWLFEALPDEVVAEIVSWND